MGVKKAVGGAIAVFGAIMLFAGLYLLPLGTDAFLYFFVEHIAGGDWVKGSIYANLFALGMMVAGILLMKITGGKTK